jgi:putative glutathione S-transferase
MTEIEKDIRRGVVSGDPSSGLCAGAGRYALYLQYGCPFAQRASIVVHLKGLQNVIPVIALDPTKTPEGFQFTGKGGTYMKDPYYGFSHIRQLYWKVEPNRKGPFTIPLLWDRKKELIVNNESSDIMRMLYESFGDLLPEDQREVNRPRGGLYPPALRPQIDAMNKWIQSHINTCVYDVAASIDQETYDTRIHVLFSALDRVEAHLGEPGQGPFLFGETITETDTRFFASVIRYDIAYYNTLRCSLQLVRYQYPIIHKWMQNLYWDESPLTSGAFRETTFFDHVSLFQCAILKFLEQVC